MFFLFPFAAEPAAAPASQRAPQYKPLPFLPEPQSARARPRPENGFASAISQAGVLAVDLLKRALSSMASSMTALGNRANALFSQLVAALAFERTMRETASFFGMFFPGFTQPWLQPNFAAPCMVAARGPAPLGAFGLPGFPPPIDPWGALTEALDMWTGIWIPTAQTQQRNPRSTPAPVNATFAFPGFSWTFALA